jgi:hypothetical protein
MYRHGWGAAEKQSASASMVVVRPPMFEPAE